MAGPSPPMWNPQRRTRWNTETSSSISAAPLRGLRYSPDAWPRACDWPGHADSQVRTALRQGCRAGTLEEGRRAIRVEDCRSPGGATGLIRSG